jgi:valyl-tRNA synthetase
VNVNSLAGAGADNNTTVCQGTSVDLSALVSIPGGSFVDQSASGGLSGSTFSTTGLSGSYMIDYVVGSGNQTCPNDTAVITVNVDDPANAGTDNNTTVCQGTTVDLSALVSVAGGIFSDPSASGGLIGSMFNTAGLSGAYALDYIVQSGNICPNDTAVITVNVDDPANAGTDNNTTVCQGTTVDLSALVSVAGGTFSDPSSSGGLSGTMFNTAGLSGAYSLDYVVTSGNTCPNDSAVITINVDDPANAGTDNTTTVCDGDVIDLSALVSVAGGTFSDPSASGGLSGTMFNTAGLAPGSFALDYVVLSGNTCPNDTAVITVNVNSLAGAGADNNTTVCQGTSVDLSTLVSIPGGSFVDQSGSGGLSGSTFNTTGLSGSYMIDYVVGSGNQTCPNDTAIITVNIDQPVFAGANNGTTVCEGTSIDMNTLLIGTLGGGTFGDPAGTGGLSGSTFNTTGLSGTYYLTYVIVSTSSCPNDTADFTIIVDDKVSAGTDNSTTVCEGAIVDLSTLVSVPGGVFSSNDAGPALSGSIFNTNLILPSTFDFWYVVASGNQCPNDTAVITVTIDIPPHAGADNSTSVCDGEIVDLTTLVSATGGTFSDPSASGGLNGTMFNSAGLAPGSFALDYVMLSGNTCPNDTAVITVNVNSLAGAGADNSTTVCQGISVDLSTLVSIPGGSFVDQSGSGGLSGSTFNTSGLSGSYMIDYVVGSGNQTCPNDTAIVTVNIDDPANAGIDNQTAVCDGEVVDLNTLVSAAGGVFIDQAATGGLSGSDFNTAGLSPVVVLIEYVVASSNSCPNDTAQISITIIPNSIATATGGVITCGNTSIQIDGMSSIAGSSFVWTGPGGFTSTDEDPIVSVPGIYTLTVNTQSNCPTSDTALVTLNNALPDVTATGGNLDCISGDVQLMGSSSTPGVSYVWTGPAGFSSTMQNPVVTDIGTYTLVVTALNGCTASDTAQVDSDGGGIQSCPLIWSCAPDTTVSCTSSLDWQVIGGPDFQKDPCCALQTAFANWTDSYSGTCPRILTRVWTAYDFLGNSETCTQTVTIIDTIPPVLVGVPNDTTVHYTMVPLAAMVIAQDDCYNLQYPVVFNEQYIPTNDPKVFTVIRTWTSVDNCGNGVSATQTINAMELNATVSVNAILEGPASVGSMTPSLLNTGNLTVTDPYGMGYTASANVMFGSGNFTPIDWVKVELRHPTFPKLKVDSMACIIQSDGTVVDINGNSVLSFPNAIAGNYYVVVDHYNHLGVMTASALDLSAGPLVDFTSPSTPVYTATDDATKYVNGVMMLWMGDVTGDNIIKYTGANNDRDPMLVIIGAVPTNVVYGLFAEDTRLNGDVKYIGAENDRDPLLVNIGGNPTNIRRAQLP